MSWQNALAAGQGKAATATLPQQLQAWQNFNAEVARRTGGSPPPTAAQQSANLNAILGQRRRNLAAKQGIAGIAAQAHANAEAARRFAAAQAAVAAQNAAAAAAGGAAGGAAAAATPSHINVLGRAVPVQAIPNLNLEGGRRRLRKKRRMTKKRRSVSKKRRTCYRR